MKLQETKLKGSYLIDLNKNEDPSGFLNKIFCQKNLSSLLKGKSIHQVNRTFSRKKSLVRGLHFQKPPHAEIKIVYCIKEKVWDLAVDLRKGSPTFLHYHSVNLTEDNFQCFFILEEFVLDFQTLTPNCEILYFHTEDYNIESEVVINSIDPCISINWPKIITERSERDNKNPMLDKNFLGFEI